jgi:GT2 family glycosyltransferase
MASDKTPPPLVSIIVSAYRAEQTVARSLRSMLAQEYHPTEIILVDSSPDPHTAEIVQRDFPQVRYERSPERLRPNAAQNRGAALARGDLLLFTNPDVYASPGWVARLVELQKGRGGAISGAIACEGNGWLQTGLHLAKFDKWLPRGGVRRTEIGATANLLVPRDIFTAVGGFEGNSWVADTVFCWALAEQGIPVWFAPGATVWHDHLGGWPDLLKERFERGITFGASRASHFRWPRGWLLLRLGLTLLPLRLAGLIARTLRNATEAGQLGRSVVTLPVFASGHAAWLAGEAVGMVAHLRAAH